MPPSISDVALCLSCSTRLAILVAASDDKTFSDLAAEIGIAASTLTHHVAVLEGAGLVAVERAGAKKYLRRKYEEVRIPLG